MENPDNAWFVWGISAKQTFSDLSYMEQTVYGITPDGQWYFNGSGKGAHHRGINGWSGSQRHNDIDTKHFRVKKCDIDLLFNVDEGEMKLCVVEGDAVADGKEAVLREIGKSKGEENNSGWVPHFNFGSTGKRMCVRLTQIPIEWYGKSIALD